MYKNIQLKSDWWKCSLSWCKRYEHNGSINHESLERKYQTLSTCALNHASPTHSHRNAIVLYMHRSNRSMSHGNDRWPALIISCCFLHMHSQELSIQKLQLGNIYWLENMLVSIKTNFLCLNSLFGELPEVKIGLDQRCVCLHGNLSECFLVWRRWMTLWGCFKGIVHPKMKILLFIDTHVISNLYYWLWLGEYKNIFCW